MQKIELIQAGVRWKSTIRKVCFLVGASLTAHAAFAADLVVHQPTSTTFSRKTVQYSCDENGMKIGAPSGDFSVEYINGGGNSLVVVPIANNSLIFSNVFSGSGARYVAQQYTWWEAGGTVTLSTDSLAGKMQATCKPVK